MADRMQQENEKIRVLLDLDGVIRDFVTGVKNAYQKEYPDHRIKEITSRKLDTFFPIGERIYEFIDREHLEEILIHAPAYSGAIEAMYKWENDFQSVLVTAQPRDWRYPTYIWIGKHRVPVNEVIITFKKYQVPGIALLDDFTENLEAFRRTDRLAVCMDQPWNRNWDGPRVKTVDEFYQLVLDYIQKNERDWLIEEQLT